MDRSVIFPTDAKRPAVSGPSLIQHRSGSALPSRFTYQVAIGLCPAGFQDVGRVRRRGQCGRPDHTCGARCRSAIAGAARQDAGPAAIGRRGDFDTLGANAVAGPRRYHRVALGSWRQITQSRLDRPIWREGRRICQHLRLSDQARRFSIHRGRDPVECCKWRSGAENGAERHERAQRRRAGLNTTGGGTSPV
jgi:hypothetical protein